MDLCVPTIRSAQTKRENIVTKIRLFVKIHIRHPQPPPTQPKAKLWAELGEKLNSKDTLQSGFSYIYCSCGS